jgi:hypothetical protein
MLTTGSQAPQTKSASTDDPSIIPHFIRPRLATRRPLLTPFRVSGRNRSQVTGVRHQWPIGTRVVRVAAQHAKAAGCEWLHVDFEAGLARFYFNARGFQPTEAGLIHLPFFMAE